MTEQQARQVKEMLQEIELERAKHDLWLKKKRAELIQSARYFDTYEEMYRFIRANTFSLKDFCLDMFEAMEVFFEEQDRRNRS